MAGLTENRNTIEIADGCTTLYLPVAAKKKIYEGALVVIDSSGNAQSATKAADLKAVGRAETFADNSGGAAGDVYVNVRRGIFVWDNDTTAAVTAANLLDSCYIVDDHTVTSTATGSSAAGKVLAITNDGVYVETL